jgi:ATP-dependent DNA helicase MPH1
MLNFKPLNSDSFAFQTWHYPTINNAERTYQQRIIEVSLYSNSLVCLPTGLGKTYIGLVVMYNFHRWFPSRKVLFLAPTRPLVNQQFKYWTNTFSKTFNVSATEMTGNLSPEKRYQAWNSNSIFFSTPQIVENDIENNLCDPNSIVCLIIDEAHRAVGNYSYCNIINKLNDGNVDFRICGLTATPGTNFQSIQKLIHTLNIEVLEYINEESAEIQPFVSLKSREVIPISSDPVIESMKSAIDDFIKDLYMIPLNRMGIHVSSEIDSISISSLSAIKSSGPAEGYLACLRIILHARDLLMFYGVNSMIHFFESIENGHSNPIKSRIKRQMSEFISFRNSFSDLKFKSKQSNFISHPKMKILSHILENHFSEQRNSETRVIIFSNYRESVTEIANFLKTCSAMYKIAPLLGASSQSNSIKYKKTDQKSTIDSFIRGDFNILVSTCIGEEGLDIGFVDLIIFYDANSSPIRLVQRSGRTGRKRDGKVIILVNENKEKRLLERSEESLKAVENALLNSKNRFIFSNSAKNPLVEVNRIRMVKFNMIAKDSINDKPIAKRNLSFIPKILCSVPDLNIRNSILDQPCASHSIQHSISTHALALVFSNFKTSESEITKCKSVWKFGLKNMPIFKPFDYSPNSQEDYLYFFSALFNTDNDKDFELEDNLPDSFFANEFSESGSDHNIKLVPNPLSEDFRIDNSFDISDLESLDWSDSGF